MARIWGVLRLVVFHHLLATGDEHAALPLPLPCRCVTACDMVQVGMG